MLDTRFIETYLPGFSAFSACATATGPIVLDERIHENAFGYCVTAERMSDSEVRVTSFGLMRHAALVGEAPTWETYRLFAAGISSTYSAIRGNGIHDVYWAADYRDGGGQEILPYKAGKVFADATDSFGRLRGALDGILRTAGLTRVRGEEPTVLDYLRAQAPAGVDRPDLHQADLAAMRTFALGQLSLLLPEKIFRMLDMQSGGGLALPRREDVAAFPGAGNVV